MAINLLPKDISKRNRENNTNKTVNYLYYFIFAVGLIVLVGGGILVFTQQRRINNLKGAQQELLVEVKDLQQQEINLVVTKNRLQTVNGILANRETSKIQDLQKLLYEALPIGTDLVVARVADQENEFTVQAASSLILRDYIRRITQLDEINSLSINQLTYSVAGGYQANFAIQ